MQTILIFAFAKLQDLTVFQTYWVSGEDAILMKKPILLEILNFQSDK